MGVLDQMSVLEDVHVKNNVSVVDYALVSSDLFSLISEFAVLDFCELYSNVRCSIVLNLSFVDKQADIERSEIDNDCVDDGDVNKTNLQHTGRPTWFEIREDEYISALDVARMNEINMLLDDEFLSPDTTFFG